MGIHEMATLDHTGHSITKWDPARPEEVEMARETFNNMRGKGHQIFAVEGADSQGRRLDSFDPSVARMMVVPQLRGG